MTGTIFLLRSDNDLVRLDEAPYKSEDLLQDLIKKHPDLLAGDQYGSETPRKWLLVQREMGIAESFKRIPGVDLDPERPYPGIRFDLLESEEARGALFEALDEMVGAIRDGG